VAPGGGFAGAWDKLNDDLNTPAALGEVFKRLNQCGDLTVDEARAAWRGLHFMLEVLGIALPAVAEATAVAIPAAVRELAERRWQARLARDWAAADVMRGELAALGWAVKDGKQGYELARTC
jgi:cysteinyl-tRNA synthetase